MGKSRKSVSIKSETNEPQNNDKEEATQTQPRVNEELKTKNHASVSNVLLNKNKMFLLFVVGLLLGMIVQHYQYHYFFSGESSNVVTKTVINQERAVFRDDPIKESESISIEPSVPTQQTEVVSKKDKVAHKPDQNQHEPVKLEAVPKESSVPIEQQKEVKVQDEVENEADRVRLDTNKSTVPNQDQSKEKPEKQANATPEDPKKLSKKKETIEKNKKKRTEEETKLRKAKREADELKRRERRKLELQDEVKTNQRSNDEISGTNQAQTKISQIKPKKMWIPIPGSNGGHRRVPAVEIKFGKEHESSVKVWLYEEFLTSEECEILVKVHDEHVDRLKKEKPIVCFDSIKTLRKYLQEFKKDKIADAITPNVFLNGTMCINQTFSRQLEKWGLKWSFSTVFYPGESKFSNIFGKLIEDATQLNQTHGGKFQITSYPNGVGFNARTDCTNNEQIDRYATFLVFLNDIAATEGGEHVFPELGIDVKPKKGRALTWNSMNYDTGKCEKESANEAKPFKSELTNAKKYSIQRWYYYKNFQTIGKRIKEPEIPPRSQDTPLVMCDEHDFGSCRLYDEWGYDHLLKYKNKKLNI